jgi:hypothetical protein
VGGAEGQLEEGLTCTEGRTLSLTPFTLISGYLHKSLDRLIRHWFMRYKSTLYCIDCGISHPAVLQFHHRNRAEKSFTIADVVRKAASIRQITNEINKCDVVCVNCHAKRHWRETHETDSWEELVPEE